MQTKEMLCIVCPNGCLLQVSEENGALTVRGNLCKRGVGFAKSELTNPTRSLTTTVRTSYPGVPVLPVRTDGEIPKHKIIGVIKELAGVTVNTPLALGDTVLANAAGTGCRVIATSGLLAELYKDTP